MPENTKTPPNQGQRQRTPQGDPRPQKPGGSGPQIDPDRDRQGRGQPMSPGKDGAIDVDDLDDDATQRVDRE